MIVFVESAVPLLWKYTTTATLSPADAEDDGVYDGAPYTLLATIELPVSPLIGPYDVFGFAQETLPAEAVETVASATIATITVENIFLIIDFIYIVIII